MIVDETSLIQFFTAGAALVSISAIFVLPLAIVITMVIIAMFRRRVVRSMQATTGFSGAHKPQVPPPAYRRKQLQIEAIDVSKDRARIFRTSRLGLEARRKLLGRATALGLAGCSVPAIVALIFVWKTGLVPNEVGIVRSAIGFGLFFLESVTPAVFALVLVLKKQVRFLLMAMSGQLAIMWAVGQATGTDPIGMWLYIASPPAAFVMLLNTRRLRAVGPIILAAALILVAGVAAGAIFATYLVLDLLRVRFVGEDGAGLSLWEAGWKWIDESNDYPSLLAQFMQVASNPSQHMIVQNPDAEGTAKILFFGICLIATVVAAAASWGLLRSFARSYEKRKASDQMLTVDVVVLIFALWVFLVLPLFARISVAAIPVAYFGYRYLSRWRLEHRRVVDRPATARILLILRVFGFDKRAQRLLDELEHRWRFLGPIRITGSPDLAYSTIKPYEFFEFLNGRLTRRFISSADELRARLAGPVTPDIDGSFRIQDFYCHSDTWQMTVSELGKEADAVAMDLRTFSQENQGCIFEIENLIATVPVRRIVMLIDHSTDITLLEETLQKAWRDMPANSPNRTDYGQRIRILRASSSHQQTVDCLLGLLCAGFGRT